MFKWLTVLLVVVSTAVWAEPGGNDGVRDPTTPLGHMSGFAGNQGEATLVLDSVLIGTKRKLAIINGETLREGQVLPGSNGIKVQRILPQTVVLQQGEKTWVLSMSPGVMKKH